jgi:hypothetical protein
MATKELRFATDEKGYKALAPTLVGRVMSYWENRQLRRGRVTAAEVLRDRYGNPYIQVELSEDLSAPATAARASLTTEAREAAGS